MGAMANKSTSPYVLLVLAYGDDANSTKRI